MTDRSAALASFGLADPFTDSELKAAWRRVSRETHPDTGGTAEHFRQAQTAYQYLLANPSLRREPLRRSPHDQHQPDFLTRCLQHSDIDVRMAATHYQRGQLQAAATILLMRAAAE